MSVRVVPGGRLLHQLRVVEDEGREVARGQRERRGGGVAGRRARLQERAGAGGVQTGLGALHPAGDLLK